MVGKGQFRFSYFTRNYDATVSFYRDDLDLPVVESWDRSADDRGTLFGAASGIIEVVFRPDSPASFHGWDDRPPQGAFMAIEVSPGTADHAAMGSSQLLPERAERTHHLHVQ